MSSEKSIKLDKHIKREEVIQCHQCSSGYLLSEWITVNLLHSLERAAAGIGLHVNAQKMEYMCFNQIGNISTLNGSSLKLVDKFTYLGSSVSSTETDINTRQAKAWTAIGHMEVKPDR